MKTRRGLTALILGSLLAAGGGLGDRAHASDPGQTVFSFLKLGVGAKATAMGEAYVTLADDATATYWNPAGLLSVQGSDLVGVHNAWILDLRQEFAGVAVHTGRHGFGVSFNALYTSEIDRRDETGQALGTFGYSDVSVSGSYAFQVIESLGLGATVRYLSQSIDSENMNAFAFDFGGVLALPVDGLSAGAALRNLGGQTGFDASEDLANPGTFDLPTTLQAGLAYRHPDFAGGSLRVGADFLAASGDDGSFRVGAEYTVRQHFLLGAGYRSGLDNENVSFGAGYENKIRVHYAYTPVYDDLGSSSRIEVGYSW